MQVSTAPITAGSHPLRSITCPCSLTPTASSTGMDRSGPSPSPAVQTKPKKLRHTLFGVFHVFQVFQWPGTRTVEPFAPQKKWNTRLGDMCSRCSSQRVSLRWPISRQQKKLTFHQLHRAGFGPCLARGSTAKPCHQSQATASRPRSASAPPPSG